MGGELALLYNCPRAATVTVASDRVSAWVLDAMDFKMMIIQGRHAEYQKYEGWLKDVDILRNLNHFELSRLAEALKIHNFQKDTDIIRQGDVGDRFFILAEGTATAFMSGDEGDVEVKRYEHQGDYFGEMALMEATKRLATVRCTSDCVLCSISKKQFTKLLGPISGDLKKNAEAYPTYSDLSPRAAAREPLLGAA